jgi:hypothetical protein
MEKVPTAEEFLAMHPKISHYYSEEVEKMVCYSDEVQQAMIEFAKLHVKAALEVAAEFADGDDIEENRDQILGAYSLSKIV